MLQGLHVFFLQKELTFKFCVCMYVWGYMNMSAGALKRLRRWISLELVTGGCGSPDMGDGK